MSDESKFENEYKNYKVDFIQLLDELDEGRWAHEPDMRAELDEVYAEAAKSYKYEAKAKLADDIITAWKTGDFDFTEGEGSLPDHGIAPVQNYHMFDFGQYVDSLLDEYESGGSGES